MKGSGKLAAVALLLAGLTYFGVDAYQSATHTGLYRGTWQGTALSVRPTLLRFIEWNEDEDHSFDLRGSRNRGHYQLTLRTDDGGTLTVGLSRRDFMRPLVGEYVVSKGGSLRAFPSRQHAEDAHALIDEAP